MKGKEETGQRMIKDKEGQIIGKKASAAYISKLSGAFYWIWKAKLAI